MIKNLKLKDYCTKNGLTISIVKTFGKLIVLPKKKHVAEIFFVVIFASDIEILQN